MSRELEAWIEDQKPALVGAAEEYVRDSGICARAGGEDMSKSQLRNLLSVCQSERSLKVLVNFLRYQIGRGNRGWKDRASGEALESVLTTRIAALCSDDRVRGFATGRREVEAALAALFLGYVIREYTYRREGREGRSHG